MVATRRRTRVQSQGAERTQKSPLLRLSAQLMRMIFDCYTLPDYPWLLTIVTTCKAFQLVVEPILYRNTTFDECKVANIFLRAVEKRPHRSHAVKSLGLDVKGGASIKAAFKRALPKLTNLVDLALIVDDASLFDLLLDVPFRLEAFAAGGQNYPSCFFDILRSQPRIDALDLSFCISKRKPKDRPQLSDPVLLPSISALSVMGLRFPLSCIQHPYPITQLTLKSCGHDDLAHAFSLFRETLVALRVHKHLDPALDRCDSRCFWPTWMFDAVCLPRLRYLEVLGSVGDELILEDEEADFDIAVVDAMGNPHLREACPALRTIVWGVEMGITEALYERGSWEEEDADPPPLKLYLDMLFEALPSLVRLALYDMDEGQVLEDGLPVADIYTREKRDVDDPEVDGIDITEWRRFELEAAKAELADATS